MDYGDTFHVILIPHYGNPQKLLKFVPYFVKAKKSNMLAVRRIKFFMAKVDDVTTWADDRNDDVIELCVAPPATVRWIILQKVRVAAEFNY